MVIDRGNFPIVNNDLKFTITWDLAHLWVSAEPHFISGHSSFTCINYESLVNFHFIVILQIAWAEMQHWIFKIFSAYNSAKITCNMSIEWKFCDLSEFVQFLKLRLLIKCIDLFNWDPADFEKWADPHKLVHLRSLSSIWKLPWSMTITTPIIKLL